MKAILVIDLPDDFLADPSNAYRLQIGGDAEVYYVRDGEKRGSIVGDTRDIKPMPLRVASEQKWYTEDKVYMVSHEFTEWDKGWNACVDYLEGEE